MTDWSKKAFYKAFTPSKDKKPIYKRADKRFEHNLKQVQSLSEFSAVLANNTILLDPDEQIHSDNLMKLIEGEKLSCMVTQRDNGRGIHALFFDDDGFIPTRKQKIMLACGIVVDAIPGRTNGLECLKFDNTKREIIYDVGEYQQLPKYLTPVRVMVDFANLDEGDGRNQTLFNYILTLQTAGFENDEARHCIRLINRYVLKTPLADDELNVILRDAAFQKPVFFKGTTFLFDKFAQYIKREYNIKKINGQIHIYKDGRYTPDLVALKSAIYDEIPMLKKSQKGEVFEVLDTICEPVKQSNVNIIGFRNGNLNIDTGELSPCSPDVIITNLIPWDYNPNATSDIVDTVLNKISCDDLEIRALIEEMIGACFYRSNTLGGGKAFILKGGKSNGKSTLLETLKVLLGTDNIATLDLKNLDDRFKTIRLYGKLANIGDDISDEYKSDTSTFKKIVTGNAIEVEQKGQPGFSFDPYVTLIFSANNIPRMKDPTEAANRRLQIVPLNAVFKETDDDYDPQIVWKLQTQPAIEYLIRLGIEGLKRVLKNKRFSECKQASDAKEEYRRENNSVLTFIEEYGVDEINNEKTSDVLRRFNAFCIENGFREIGITKLTRDLKQIGFTVELLNPPKSSKAKAYKVYVWSGQTLQTLSKTL